MGGSYIPRFLPPGPRSRRATRSGEHRTGETLLPAPWPPPADAPGLQFLTRGGGVRTLGCARACAHAGARLVKTRCPPSPHTRWALTAQEHNTPWHSQRTHASSTQHSSQPPRCAPAANLANPRPDCTHTCPGISFCARLTNPLRDTHPARTQHPPLQNRIHHVDFPGHPPPTSSDTKPSGRQFILMILRNNLIDTIIHN